MPVKTRPVRAGEGVEELLPTDHDGDEIIGIWVGDGLALAGLDLPWTERRQLETMLEKGLHPVTGEPVGEPFTPLQVVAWDLDFVANPEAYSPVGNPGATRGDVRKAVVGVPGKYRGCQSKEAVAAVESTGVGLVGVMLSRPEPWPKGRVRDHVVVWSWAFPVAGRGQATALTPEVMTGLVAYIGPRFDAYLEHEAITDELYNIEVY